VYKRTSDHGLSQDSKGGRFLHVHKTWSLLLAIVCSKNMVDIECCGSPFSVHESAGSESHRDQPVKGQFNAIKLRRNAANNGEQKAVAVTPSLVDRLFWLKRRFDCLSLRVHQAQ
jgi:hypothetical protein